MKKGFVFILSLLYLTTALGTGINLHYCMDKLVGSSLFVAEEEACSMCGMDKADKEPNPCCKDEHKQVKVQDDHGPATQQLLQMQAVVASLPPAFFDLYAAPVATADFLLPKSHAPPIAGKLPVYLRNRTFRI